jgi:hypothetical protein
MKLWILIIGVLLAPGLAAQSDFDQFLAGLKGYQDSIQAGIISHFPIPEIHQNCKDCHLTWIAPYGLQLGEPKRVRKQKPACRQLRKFKKANRKALRSSSSYGKAYSSFQYVGQRYLIVEEERILSSVQGLRYYFVCDLPQGAAPYSAADFGLLPDTFLLSDLLQPAALPSATRQNHLKPWGNSLYPADSSHYQIAPDSRWQLEYFQRVGWYEPVPSYQIKYQQFFQATVDTSLSYTALADLFQVANDSLPLSVLLKPPIIFQLTPNDSTNSKWIARQLRPNWLLLQRISSYPHGSQTSWYREERYYFVREN